MGQYFRPVHVPTNTAVKNFPFVCNGGLTWIPKVFYFTDEELLEKTEIVAKAYGWDVNDIVWVGDYGQVVSLKNGVRDNGDGENHDNPLKTLAWEY